MSSTPAPTPLHPAHHRSARPPGRRASVILVGVAAAVVIWTMATAVSAARPATAAEPPVIAKYRELIPRLMSDQHIPGLALALVDENGIIWAEGFGFTDRDGRVPITPDTMFSVQSMSKLFTALGVMRAVQAGVVELDAPITTYLPDFTVNSVFEDHPERKITLRHLLSHTAGFTHEAPIGNNWDADATSFEAHIGSLADTWLRYPVGTGYAYCNLGIDLAGYVVQVVTGQPFAEYQRAQVLQPLGMGSSSFDMAAIGRQTNRAIGHSGPMSRVPTAVPMVPAGGLYSSANDLARFIQFALNEGTLDGQPVLGPALLDEMTTVQFPVRGQRFGYGLGVARTGWYRGRNADLFSHGGGGFGFLSDLWWLPEVKVGIALLTNSSEHTLQGGLALDILYDLTHMPGPYADRLAALPYKTTVTEDDGAWLPPATLEARLSELALPPDVARWQDYLGEYKSATWNVINPATPPSRVYEQDGALYFDGTDMDDPARLRLYETTPGLFFSETGEALDFRETPPTYRNIPLARVGPGPSQLAWGVLGACGLVMLSVLIMLPARPIWRRMRRASLQKSTPTPAAAAAAATTLAVAGSLCGLASIAALALLPRLIYSGFLGWLELPIHLELLLRAPLGLALSAAALAVLVVAAWRRGWWGHGERWQYTALAGAALAETALLAHWRLIGAG